MKAIVHIGLSWQGYYRPQGPKSPEELDRDRRRVREILQRMGYDHLFRLEQHYYNFTLEKGDRCLDVLIEQLQKWPELASPHIRVEHRYARQELEAADLLVWSPTNQAIEDDYYDLHEDGYQGGPCASHTRCRVCRAELQQVRDLAVNKALVRGKDVSLTYSFEVILSERVAQLFQEQGLTGLGLRPVRHYKKPYEGEPALYQLVVTNVLPTMASPPTEFERVRECSTCGRRSQFLKHEQWWGKIRYIDDTDIYYPCHVSKIVKDFNHTAENFGELPAGGPYVIITQQVYRLLREHKVKNWTAVPVYMID